jgi:pimeloyl-ACP methyl ester carboxylesterase
VRTGRLPLGAGDGRFEARVPTARAADLRVTAEVLRPGRPPLHGRPAHLRVGPGEIVDLPVAFRVVDVDRTPDACQGNGATYTVRGHLVGPRAKLVARRSSVALYLHGSVLGEPSWRFRGVPGYDTLRRLAEAGHLSVSYDGLGYGRSDAPFGFSVCGGTEADVAHQLVGALRARGFARVALVGFSFGGYAAEVEAYSFHDVDALGVEGWSDHLTNGFYEAFVPGSSDCSTGGRRKHPGGAAGYRYFFHYPDEHVLLANAAPPVVAALYRAHELDPCGLAGSAAQIMRNPQEVAAIRVPVLLVYGARDALFPSSSQDAQRADYTGTRDLTFRRIGNAGHLLQLERSSASFRSLLAAWLGRHGF